MVICKNCDKEISGDFKFCPECGTKIPAAKDNDISYLEVQDKNALEKESESSHANVAEINHQKETSTNYKSNPFKKRKVVMVAILSIIILTCIAGGTYKFISDSISDSKSDLNYEKGLEELQNGNYGQAIAYLKESYNEKAAEPLQIAWTLKDSENSFNYGMRLYDEKMYDNALTQFLMVNKSSDKYKKAQEMITTCKQNLFDENLEKAKAYYNQKDYIAANNSIQAVLKYDSKNTEIIELNSNNVVETIPDLDTEEATEDMLSCIKNVIIKHIIAVYSEDDMLFEEGKFAISTGIDGSGRSMSNFRFCTPGQESVQSNPEYQDIKNILQVTENIKRNIILWKSTINQKKKIRLKMYMHNSGYIQICFEEYAYLEDIENVLSKIREFKS